VQRPLAGSAKAANCASFLRRRRGGRKAACGTLGHVIRRRLIVHGRVQGVFFRDTTRRAAAARGVAGWVRNCPDGTVEAAFEGEPEAVEAMVELCRQGPRGALVERVEVRDEEPRGLGAFEVR
jgi:acylphosphatase